MKPRILVSGTENKMENYIRAFSALGVAVDGVYAPVDGFERYDGLVLAGGGDLSSERSCCEAGLCSGVDLRREESDWLVIPSFMERKRPILGICRGLQLLNVYFGGTLVGDLGEENHRHNGVNGADNAHSVNVCSDNILQQLYDRQFRVNSYHHQGISVLAPGFQPLCTAEDGLVEAISRDKILAVQWHPERWSGGEVLLEHFISLCK